MTTRNAGVVLHSLNNRLMSLSLEVEFLERSSDVELRLRGQRMRQIIETIATELRELVPPSGS